MDDRATLDHIERNRERLLGQLDRQLAVVRDYVRGVDGRYSAGLYLYGPPGTGKTHTVRGVLEREVKRPYVYQRGHLTPVGLFELFEQNSDEVIVLDDLASVFKNDVALQILLSALERPTARDGGRVAKDRRMGQERRVVFRGGVVCVSNRVLHNDELLAAFKSRVHVLNYDPSDAQAGALILEIAGRGAPAVTPAEALEVARHAIAELLRVGCRFDLRLLVSKALPDYRQWRDGRTESDWRDLVSAAVEENLLAARAGGGALTREARKDGETAILRQILREHATLEARVRAWVERTGKSERAFYRRLAELQ